MDNTRDIELLSKVEAATDMLELLPPIIYNVIDSLQLDRANLSRDEELALVLQRGTIFSTLMLTAHEIQRAVDQIYEITKESPDSNTAETTK